MTGWTWEYVANDMTLPRLEHLRRQWMKYPPAPLIAGINMRAGGDAPGWRDAIGTPAPSSAPKTLDETVAALAQFGINLRK